jgi:hypothetical protein
MGGDHDQIDIILLGRACNFMGDIAMQNERLDPDLL